MELKDILVHVDNRPTCEGRLKVASNLAKRHGARLTGLYVEPHLHFWNREREPQGPSETARARFEEWAAAAGVEREFIQIDTASTGLGAIEALNLYACYRDLLVVSQTDPDASDRSIPSDLPDRTVLGCGRPVLIVPYAGDFETLGKRILLAWRGGPESARATHDAMPLLKTARRIEALSVQGGDELPCVPGGVLAHLERHGVQALEGKISPGELSVGDVLLNHAADTGSDLLVMGAYSQLRRGYPSLGEVGRHLLKYMTLPVLMSH